jgi:hypothetical protein
MVMLSRDLEEWKALELKAVVHGCRTSEMFTRKCCQ